MADQPEAKSSAPPGVELPLCPINTTDNPQYFDRSAKGLQKFAALVAVGAAISEVIAIYRRGKAKEKQNIWTPLLLMVVKYCYAFQFYCAGLRDFQNYKESLGAPVKKNILKIPFAYNFTYFSKAVAFILWGITFFMVMTVQIHCGLKCDNEDKARMDLSLHALYIALVVPLAIMALIYWRFIALGKEHPNPERQLIHASMTCSTLLMIGVGIVLGLASSNYFSF